MWRRLLVFVGTALFAGVACTGEVDVGLSGNTMGSAQVTELEPTPTTQSINEGDNGTFSIDVLCNNTTGQQNDVVWDFGVATDATDQLLGTVTASDGQGGCASGSDYDADWTTAAPATLQAPSWLYGRDGTFTVNVAVSDADGVSIDQDLTVEVANVLPIAALSAPGGILREGDSLDFTGSVTDPGTDNDGADREIRYVYWQWGDGSATVATDCVNNPGDDAICGSARSQLRTHVFGDNNTYQVWLRVCDNALAGDGDPAGDGDGFGSPPFGCDDTNVAVVIENDPPVVTPIARQYMGADVTEINEGLPLELSASFSDDGYDTHDLTWDYGDGDSDTGTADTDPPPNPSDLSPANIMDLTHTYCNTSGTSDQLRNIVFTVQDDDNGSSDANRSITIHDIEPVIDSFTSTVDTVWRSGVVNAINEGQSVTFEVTAHSDSDFCDPLHADDRYDWDCGTGPDASAQVVAGCGDMDTTCTCLFPDGEELGGAYTVEVGVRDDDGSVTLSTIDMTVYNLAPAITEVLYMGPVTEGVGQAFTGTFTDASTTDTYSYTWSYEWPSTDAGNEDSGTVNAGMGAMSVGGGSHTYLDDGTYTLRLTVMDDDGGTTYVDTTVTVDDVDPSGTFTVAPTAADEGTTSVVVNIAASAANSADALSGFVVTWGDGDTTPLTSTDTAATHVYRDNGTYGVSVAISDEDSTVAATNGPDTSVDVEVSNVAPVISNSQVTIVGTVSYGGAVTYPAGSGDAVTVEEGELITFNGEFTDPSSEDTYPTITWEMVQNTVQETFTEAINTAGNGSDPIALSAQTYIFPEDGVWSVILTVTDDDGGSDSYTFTVNVSDVDPENVVIQADAINEGDDATILVSAVSGAQDDPSADDIGAIDDDDVEIDCEYDGSFDPTVVVNVTNGSGQYEGTCSYAQDGVRTVAARIWDEDSYTQVTTSLTVNNVPPVITLPTGPLLVQESQFLTIGEAGNAASFVDPGSLDTWTARWTFTDPKDGSPVELPVAGAAPGVELAAVGPYLFEDDESGLVAPYRSVCAVLHVMDDDIEVSSPLTVTDGCLEIRVENTDPRITVVDTNSPVGEGTAMNFFVTAEDDGNPVDPPRIYDPFTYRYTWGDGTADTTVVGQTFASHIFASQGEFTVRVTVEDDDGGSTFFDVDVRVINIPPEFVDVLTTSPKPENSLVQVTPVLKSYNVGELVYEYDFNCTNPAAPAYVVGNAVGSHLYTQDGTYNVCTRVTDDAGDSDERTDITVTVTNVAPVVTFMPPAAINEGQSAIVNVTATDVGPEDSHTFEIDWNDGNGFVAAVSGDNTSPNVYGQSGVNVIRARVYDDDTFSEAVSQLVVNNVAPEINTSAITIDPAAAGVPGSVDEGTTVTLTVPVSDDGGDFLTLTYDWTSDGVIDDVRSGVGPHTAAFTYTQDGTYNVTLRLTDGQGGEASHTVPIYVDNVAPTITSVSSSSPVTAGSALAVSIVATDPGDDALTYEWDFDADGSYEFTSSNSNVGYHTYDSSGEFTVNVRVTDGAGSDVDTITVQVTDISVAMSVTASQSTIDEGGSTTVVVNATGTGPYDIAIDWDNNGSFEETYENVADSEIPLTSAAHVFEDNGQYRVTARVVDHGASDSIAASSTTVRVDNVAPTFTSTTPPTTVAEDEAYTYTLVATDPGGAADPLVYTLLGGPLGLTVDPQSGAVAWAPSYSDFGIHPVEVKVEDGDGGMDNLAWNITVTIVDADSDGMSDAWETANNVTNPADDPDGDGLTNLEEFEAGTDPNFSNAPGAPIALQPVEVTVAELEPSLVVHNAIDPDGDELSYTFEVYDNEELVGDPVFEGTVGGSEGTTAIAVEPTTELADQATYWWRCFASDALADGPYSEVTWFVIDTTNQAPAAPAILVPVLNATVNTIRPYLEVSAVVDPDGDTVTYDFALYSDEGMTTEVTSVSGRSLPLWIIDTDLEAGGEYWWVAYASDGLLTSPASNTGHFMVSEAEMPNEPPTAPTINSPQQGAVLTSTSTDLEVDNATDPDEDDVLSYYFELADNAAFAGTSVQASAAVTEGTNTTSWAVSSLAEDTTYFWRARVSDGEAFSDWATGTFAVNAVDGAPSVPMPITPSDGALLNTAPTALVAQNAMDPEGQALTYTFEIASDADGTDVLATSSAVLEGQGTTSWEIEGVDFTAGSTYFWRVRATDGSNTSDFSAMVSFKMYKAPKVTSPADDDDDDDDDDGGCGCAAAPSGASFGGLVIGLAALLMVRRRR